MIIKRRDISTLHAVRQFIETNITKGILVDALCREFGLNRTKLQEGFNQLYGVSVHAFVSRARMDKARVLLLETDESIKVIAIECGYRSVSGFTRVFTRLHSMSPSQYRAVVLSNIKPPEKIDGLDN